MALKVLLPVALRHLTGNRDEVELSGECVGEVIDGLVRRFPELKPHLLNDEGQVRNFVNVYINDEDVRYLQEDRTPVKEGDVVSIVPSIAGGNLRAVEAASDSLDLSQDEIQRYSRHIIMPEVGMEGQKKLKAAKILLIGTGGLGAPLGLYLSAAGIGKLGLVDFDTVDFSNLQRQVIHGTADVGRPKLDSAREKILAINPNVQVETYDAMLTSENALDIIPEYDIVIDGTDNFPTRYLVNDALRSSHQAQRLWGASFDSRARLPCSTPGTVPATAASIRSRPPRDWFPVAPRGESWESSRESSDWFRPPKPSS